MTYDEVYVDVKFGMLATDIICDFGDSRAPEKRPQHIDPATSMKVPIAGIQPSYT